MQRAVRPWQLSSLNPMIDVRATGPEEAVIVRGVTVVSVVGLLLAFGATVHAEGDPVVVLDDAGSVGVGASLVLDGQGFPVVSYWDTGNSNVKLVHCDDPGCGGANSVSVVDDLPEPNWGETSLVLDGLGNPVVAYGGFTDAGLRLAHCNDPDCAGGDESISTLDDSGGFFASLVLDESGHPIIAYSSGDSLKLAHCNDPDCVGADESISTVSSLGGTWAELQLDESGHPVIVHYAQLSDGLNHLTLVHCNDPDCIGGDESVTSLEQLPQRFWNYVSPSLAMDSAGRPVISYIVAHDDVYDLMVLRCDDPNCVGGGEKHVLVDVVTGGEKTSLVLDDQGNPVIAYSDQVGAGVDPETNLLLATCADPLCAQVSGPIVTLDASPGISRNPSLALSESGHPVVAYEDLANTALKLVACDDLSCISADGDRDRDDVPDTADNCPDRTNTDQANLDSDQQGDFCDLDDDNDGQRDLDEIACGSNPLDQASTSPDANGDGIPDCVDQPAPPTTTPIGVLPPTGSHHAALALWAMMLVVGGAILARVACRRGG